MEKENRSSIPLAALVVPPPFGTAMLAWSVSLAETDLTADGPRPPEPPELPQPLQLNLPQALTPQTKSALLGTKGAIIPGPTWRPLGPAPIPNGQTQPADANGISTTQAPVSGRTIQIVVDPVDATGNTAYVGTAQGGLYRTLNGGSTWTPLLDNALSLAVGSLALDPTDPNTLLVGTGEANFSADSYAGVGVYKITDVKGPNPVLSGPYSQEADTGKDISAHRSMSGLAVDPNNHDIVYAGTSTGQQGNGPQPPTPGTAANRGLYRSTNFFSGTPTFTKIPVIAGSFAGATEPNPSDYRVRDIKYEPGSSDRMFVDIADNNTSTSSPPYFGGLYYTANASSPNPTFTRVWAATSGIFVPAEIAVRRHGNIVTVVIATGEQVSSATDTGKAYKATYDATNPPASGPTFTELTAAQGFAGQQGSYNLGVDIDPLNANNIYICGTVNAAGDDPRGAFIYSRDGGTTFNSSTTRLHADCHAIGVAPANPNVIYTGNDGGIWRTTTGTTTVDWTELNNSTFSATQFQSIAVHPTDRYFSIGGTQDNGTEFLKPDGTWKRADFGDGGFALIDQTATDTENVTMYHTYFNAKTKLIAFSRVKKASCATEGQWALRGIAVGLLLPGLPLPFPVLPVCDGSESQVANGLDIADDVNFYAPMALGPPVTGSVGQTLYFGTDKLYRSIDQGDHMTPVSAVLRPATVVGPPPANSPVSAIAISPQDDNYRCVGTNDGHVFLTTLGAEPVDVTDANMPLKYVGRITFDPTNKNIVYVVFNGNAIPGKHVWKGTISGVTATWAAIDGSGGTALPDISVNAIAVDARNSQHIYVGTDRFVYASTDGGGNWAVYGSGLPPVQVFDIAIQNPFHLLRVATHGRGYFEIPTAVATGLISVHSRKAHGTSGTFDIDLPQTGTPATECRGSANNSYQMVFGFGSAVTGIGAATVSRGTGQVDSVTTNGSEVVVDLSGVTDVQTITVTLTDVTGVSPGGPTSVEGTMRVLVGDTSNDSSVNSGDAQVMRNLSGQTTDGNNFRSDVNADGTVNSADAAIIRSRSGHGF